MSTFQVIVLHMQTDAVWEFKVEVIGTV